jgi:hypothetical protein
MYLELTHDWENQWNPRAYLSQYYQTSQIPQDEQAVYQFIHSRLDRWSEPVSSALDIGVGPTLHHEIALAPYVQRLDLADYLPQNLAEIRKWLEDDDTAHNWDVFIKGILKIEGMSNPGWKAIEARKCLVKQHINRLLPCNIKQTFPLDSRQRYPLVTAFYVADSVAGCKADWYRYMTNIANLVEPGGRLLISALRNAEYYRVGDRLFPSAMVNEDDVEAFYLSLNFIPDSLDIRVDNTPALSVEGFDSIILASGKKRIHD